MNWPDSLLETIQTEYGETLELLTRVFFPWEETKLTHEEGVSHGPLLGPNLGAFTSRLERGSPLSPEQLGKDPRSQHTEPINSEHVGRSTVRSKSELRD